MLYYFTLHSQALQSRPRLSDGRRESHLAYTCRPGFPDQSDKFDHLLHNIDGGVILRKKKHPQPPLNFDDPMFNYKFDESIHAKKIKSELLLDHLLLADAAAFLP
jgi:hypothetical protein